MKAAVLVALVAVLALAQQAQAHGDKVTVGADHLVPITALPGYTADYVAFVDAQPVFPKLATVSIVNSTFIKVDSTKKDFLIGAFVYVTVSTTSSGNVKAKIYVKEEKSFGGWGSWEKPEKNHTYPGGWDKPEKNHTFPGGWEWEKPAKNKTFPGGWDKPAKNKTFPGGWEWGPKHNKTKLG